MTANEKLITYTHRTLNYLYASYQGEFAFLNILSQFKHPEFSKEKLTEVRENLNVLKSYLKKLWNNNIIFAPNSGPDNLQSQKDIMQRLQVLKKDLNSAARNLKGLTRDKDDITYRIASFGRASYAKDNFVRGVLKFEKMMNREQDDGSQEYIIQTLKQNLELTNEFLKAYKDPSSLSPAFYDHLQFSCRTLPGIFRTQSHDILQILAGTKGDISFKEAGFHEIEARAWKEYGLSAIEAGYWRAFELTPQEVDAWKAVNFIEPLITAEWNFAKFKPEQAIQWFEVLFTPLLAIQWQGAGFYPRDAALLVDMGYSLPSDIPEGKVEELLEQAYNQFPDDR